MKLLITVLFILFSAAVCAQSVELAPSTDDIIFYESFDKIMGIGGNDGTLIPGGTAIKDKTLFDNSDTEINGVLPGYQCIQMSARGEYYYKTPKLNVITDGKAILSFRMIGRDNYWAGSDYLTISCTNGSLSMSNFVAEKGKWNTYFTVADEITATTQFEFRCAMTFLDDITVYAVPSALDQSKNNNTYIIGNSDQEVDVPLIRTLTPNIWCPLCLPFDVTQSQMDVATGTTCELRTLIDIKDGVFMFDRATSISAGTPFLVKVNEKVENPVFENVTVVNTPAATLTGTTSGYSFVGTYSPVELHTDGTHLFLDTEGELSQPDTAEGYNRMNGLRAYFVVPDAYPARVYIPDNTVDINRINNPIVSHRTYDLHGRYVGNIHTKGLRIRNGRKYFIPWD